MWTCHIFLYVDLHCSFGTVYWVIFEGNMISIYVFGLCHISFYVELHCSFGKYWCNIIYWWQLNVPIHFYFDLSHISLCELTLQFWDFFFVYRDLCEGTMKTIYVCGLVTYPTMWTFIAVLGTINAKISFDNSKFT